MRPVLVVAPDPLIQVGLQLGDRAVDALAERDPIELVQHRLVEALNDAVRLWAFGLGAGVVNILQSVQGGAKSGHRGGGNLGH